jgi:dihydroorotate dehydrogenase (fumarate)
MQNIRTTYLGLELAHPFMVGACPATGEIGGLRRIEDAGASAVVLRSLYAEQLRAESVATHQAIANPAESYSEALSYLPAPDEFVLGPDDYLQHVAGAKVALDIPVIASLNGVEPGPWLEYATRMQEAGADAIELNLYDVVTDPGLSAADVEDRALQIMRELRTRTRLPIAVKLSPFYTALPNFAARLIDAGATGLVLFNRFFEPDINTEELEIVPHLALSNQSELLLRLRWLAILSGAFDCPLAVTGGVHDEHDAVKAIMAGAHAVQLVSAVFIQGEQVFATMRDALADWLEEHEYASLDVMRGSMNMDRGPNPAALTRAQYVRQLQTWMPMNGHIH